MIVTNPIFDKAEEEADESFVKVFKVSLLIEFLGFSVSAFPRLQD